MTVSRIDYNKEDDVIHQFYIAECTILFGSASDIDDSFDIVRQNGGYD